MNIRYNEEIIENILDDLRRLTGMSMCFLDDKREMIIRENKVADYCSVLQQNNCKAKELCSECDDKILKKCSLSQKLEYHICHAGLCDAAMPIIKNEKTVGFMIFGRIKGPASPKRSKYHSDNVDLDSLYNNLPTFTHEQIKSFHDLLSHIFFEKAIEIENLTLIETVTDYIDKNLEKDLSLNALCRSLNVNKNALYCVFKQFYNKTVIDYIIDKRIEKAKELLTNTDKKIYVISTDVGLDNYSYFCKLFKDRVGRTPTEYRKTAGS